MSEASKATQRLSEQLEGREGQGQKEGAKFEPADREQKRDAAADSSLENYGDTKPTRFIAAHPVASGGFSTSSVSEEFVKGLKQIDQLLEASVEEKMQAGNVDKPADNKASEEAGSSGGDKGAKDELNRTLKFQINPQPGGNRRVGHGPCKCRSKTCGRSRSGGKRGAVQTCSGSCRRRHRSASCGDDQQQQQRRRFEEEGEPAARGGPQASRSHRHHVHHHRHQHRVRDKEAGHDDGCALPSANPAWNRRCCRDSAATASHSCRVGKSSRHGTSRERHRPGCTDDKSSRAERGEIVGGKNTCSKKKNRKGGSKSVGVFSRYRSNYCSADTDQSSSTSSSEDDERGAAREAGLGRADDGASKTFTFTQTRQSSSPVCSRRDDKRGRSRSNCSTGRCAEGPVESTVEKHVLELNFPPSPLMRSISNLLEQSCRCPAAVEEKTPDVGGESAGDDDGGDNGEDRFVHHMKPGQTCELHGDSQVILVSLPEPHKLTVEHVIRKSDSLIERERRHRGAEDRELQQGAARGKCRRSRSRDAVRHQDVQAPPRFRRKHSYVRYTTRRKRGETCRDAQTSTKVTDPHQDLSPESDSSEDHDGNYFPDSKEKGTEEVVVHPAVKTIRPTRDHDGGKERPLPNTCRQREIKLTIPKPSAHGCYPAETEKDRSSRYRGRMQKRSRASVERDDVGGDGSGEASCGANDNTLRIVFTDSRLNTELRCILQDSCSDSRGVGDRQRCSSRTAIGRRGSGGSCTRRAQETTSDDTDFVSADSGSRSDAARRGCVGSSGTGRPPPRARRFPDASDIVSSSYYSSTHESSLALDEAAAHSGCRLCNAKDLLTACRNPPRMGTRHRHTYQHCRSTRNC